MIEDDFVKKDYWWNSLSLRLWLLLKIKMVSPFLRPCWNKEDSKNDGDDENIVRDDDEDNGENEDVNTLNKKRCIAEHHPVWAADSHLS